jgi:hypothetical protein
MTTMAAATSTTKRTSLDSGPCCVMEIWKKLPWAVIGRENGKSRGANAVSADITRHYFWVLMRLRLERLDDC